jgi:hypothetical protein
MRRASDSLEEHRPKIWRELLRIVQAVESPQLEEDDSGCDDGTSEWPSAGFVDPGDKSNAPLLESAFLPK